MPSVLPLASGAGDERRRPPGACSLLRKGLSRRALMSGKINPRLLLGGLSDIKQRSFLGARFLRSLRGR